jgi:hypothetical protein
MPTSKDPSQRRAKAAPRPRRKSKPNVEVPVETGIPEAPVAWVYRADDTVVPEPPLALEPQRVEEIPSQNANPNPLLLAGMGVFLLGVGTMGLMSLAAIELLATPMRVAKRAMVSK